MSRQGSRPRTTPSLALVTLFATLAVAQSPDDGTSHFSTGIIVGIIVFLVAVVSSIAIRCCIYSHRKRERANTRLPLYNSVPTGAQMNQPYAPGIHVNEPLGQAVEVNELPKYEAYTSGGSLPPEYSSVPYSADAVRGDVGSGLDERTVVEAEGRPIVPAEVIGALPQAHVHEVHELVGYESNDRDDTRLLRWG